MNERIPCENRLCIYWKEYRCSFSSISLDALGNCDACIYPNIPEPLLQRLKQQTRRQLDQRWKDR